MNLLGKKKDDFTWLSERIDILTKNKTFNQINSGNVSYIPTFRTGAWTIMKEMILPYYSPKYIQIMRNQPHISQLNYLDLFSGSGVIEIEGLKRYYLGSPLIVTKTITEKFDKYYFFEKDSAKTSQLNKLLDGEENVIIKTGDCNELVDSVLKQISGIGSHSLIFIDPFAMEIDFKTIRKFAGIGCDFVITVSTEEIFRAVRQWFANPDNNSTKTDSFFGGEEWKIELKDIKNDEEIFDYYSQKIVQYAFKKTPRSTKVKKTVGGRHYFILFTSTGGKGEKPEFFKIIDTFNSRIERLNGDEISRYLEHYVEGGGTSLSGFFS